MISNLKGNTGSRICFYVKPNEPAISFYSHRNLDADMVMMKRDNMVAYINKNIFKEGKARYPISEKMISYIMNAINNNIHPNPRNCDPMVFNYYNLAVENINVKLPITYIAENGCRFYPCPTIREDQRDFTISSAPAGAGKSFLLADYCSTYHFTFPNRKIYLFSHKEVDKALDKLPYIERIPKSEFSTFIDTYSDIAEEVIKKPKKQKKSKDDDEDNDEDTETIEEVTTKVIIEKKSLENCLVCFDDIEHIKPESLLKKVYEFKTFICEVKRSAQVDVYLCNHMMMDYRRTRAELSEATAIVLFPEAVSDHHMTRYLGEYLCIDAENIERLIDEKNRWVHLYTTHPMVAVTEKEVWMVKKKKK
jgi:hypothetical protein